MSAKKLHYLLCVLLSFSVLVAQAQDKTVTGKVTDSKDGSPVAGASVQAKGSRSGTATSSDGSFRITVSSGVTTLVISSVGFNSIDIDITGKSSVEISMVAQPGGLSEVVVTGYGSTRKKDVTGSIASVKAKDFNKGVVTAPDQLIQGKVAGLQVVNNSGQPGGAATIRIRGTSSVRSGNNPLIVVDGVPLDGGSGRPGLGTAVGSSPAGNPLAFINPNDIASMDVLKDASAAAIYGSRGANGVIIITTKKGQSGSPQLEVGYSVGVSSIVKQLDVLSGDEYRAALTKYGLTSGNYGDNVNMMDEILQTGITHNVNIAASGGNENGRYRISGSVLDEKGIIKESGLQKYTLAFNGNFKFLDSKKLGIDIQLSTAQLKEDVVPITNDPGFQGNLIGQALQWNPTHPIRKTNGTFWIEPQFGSTSINPLFFLTVYEDVVNTSTIFGSLSPYYKFSNAFEYRFLYSLNQSEGSRKYMIGKTLTNIPGTSARGIAAVANNRLQTQQFTHTLSFNKQINSALSLNAVVGYEYTKFDFRGAGMSANPPTTQPFDDIGIPYYNMFGYIPPSARVISNFESPTNELQSYFARTVFNLNNKYILTATIRADGSTKFGENNKYGYFPSFSAAWNLSSEKFMQNMDFVKNVKLRAGWGQTGNQEFPSGASQDRYGVTGVGALSRLNVANPELRWETSTTFNAGLDFSLMNNKINVTVDYFNKETDDVLFELDFPVPGAANVKQWKNLPALITNKGLELTVNANVLSKGDFTWNFGVNGAFLRNRLEGLQGTYNTGRLTGQGSSGAFVQKLASGYPLNVYYLRDFQGIDKTTGQSIYAQDGDVSYYMGSPNPTTLIGLSTDLGYKKWSLVANMNGAFGHYLFNETSQSVVPITNLGTRNIAASLLEGSIKEDLSNPITSSDRYLEKGNYIKMANATLSYNLGGFMKFIKNATISLTGQNLFVLTDYTGFDPEVNVDKNIGGVPSTGIEYIPYPSARRFQLSINLGL